MNSIALAKSRTAGLSAILSLGLVGAAGSEQSPPIPADTARIRIAITGIAIRRLRIADRGPFDCGSRIADCGFSDCGLRIADCGFPVSGKFVPGPPWAPFTFGS